MLLSFLAKCHFGVLLTVLFGTAVSQPVGSYEWTVGQVPTHGQEESTLFGAEHGWHSVHPEAAFPNSPGAWSSGSVAPAAINSRWDGAQAVGSSQAPAVGSHAPAPAPFHPHVLESQGAQLHNGFASSSAAHPIDWFADNAHHAFGVRLTRMLAAREAFGGDRRQWETWSEHMRRAMGSRELQISPVNVGDYGYDRVFIAQDGHAVSGFYPPLTQALPRSPSARHLLGDIVPGKLEGEREVVGSRDRVYVYLNSRVNMDYINREYFLGHAQFLPIQPEKLSRKVINKVYAVRRNTVVLPPRTPHGLPLLVIRHTGVRGVSEGLEAITGVGGDMQRMSLWSPVLYDGKRYTTVLYGVVVMDPRHNEEVLAHLLRQNALRDSSTYATLYALADVAHEFH
ncbi:hypothetical protein PaG_06521 [Moesziomyces aphidis]|uniref:Uncharacterized protein n=1 Tax=Moesziomyces aphidis TaxID=84754 RepID=W3VFJ4_MOEAP|nr:hypothetical protein PaG_06521 [Moesziomyces aphidis]